MTQLTLSDTAGTAAAINATMWPAIKSRDSHAAQDRGGGDPTDPVERMTVSEQNGAERSPDIEGATETSRKLDALALKLAVVDAEVRGLWALLEEMKTSRDDLRLERDKWRRLAETSLTGDDEEAPVSHARHPFAWPISSLTRKTA